MILVRGLDDIDHVEHVAGGSADSDQSAEAQRFLGLLNSHGGLSLGRLGALRLDSSELLFHRRKIHNDLLRLIEKTTLNTPNQHACFTRAEEVEGTPTGQNPNPNPNRPTSFGTGWEGYQPSRCKYYNFFCGDFLIESEVSETEEL